MKSKLLWKVLLLALLSLALLGALRWALRPGFWHGNMLGGGDTPLLEARHHFGPLLLVHHWIHDSPGTWGTQSELLQTWGFYESAARLVLIIVVLWLVVCIQILFRKKRSA